MGLDISSYGTLTPPREGHPIDEDSPYAVRISVPSSFKDRADVIEPGLYWGFGTRLHFRAGAYSYYNHWRKELAALVGTTPEAVWDGGEAAAFGELIHFSDCEGTIGPKTSVKLLADFRAWRERAVQHECRYVRAHDFMRLYDLFEAAFMVASKGGAVTFH